MRPLIAAAFVLTAAFGSSAQAMPLPPKVLIKPDATGPINVKVRRIGELKMSSTTAPPPAVALTGTHKMLVILVDTMDSPWPASGYDKSRFEEMLFSRSTASLREYFRENSYGAFDVTGAVVGPIRLKGDMKDFAFEMGGSNDKVRRLISEAVNETSKRGVKLTDFDTHDTRGKAGVDGILDHLMVVYAEKTGDPQGFSPIWPHRGSMDWDGRDAKVTSYVVLNHGAPLGVYVHEFGHDIGLPDLYDRDYTSHGTGTWCLMGAGGWGENGSKPSHISAWGKMRLGWIVPTMVTNAENQLTVPSSSEKPFALKVPIQTIDAREYFLIENRRKVGFDASLPAEGLVVYHIDETKADNDDEKRKMVDVIEAAPVQDLDALEQGRFPDYLPDVFFAGGKANLDDETAPGMRANSGQPTKMAIEVTSPPDRVMQVTIKRPAIFNPGGMPYVLEKDGYRYGRFGFVQTGKGSEALIRLEATPGGYLAYGAEVFVSGPAIAKGSITVNIYEDNKGSPGKLLVQKTVPVTTGADGYEWVRARLAKDEQGVRIQAHQRFWVGVVSDDGKFVPAFNPFSKSKQARFRRKGSNELVDKFNFKEGAEPVPDYIIRISGFGYVSGIERPEPLAAEDDREVKRMFAADKLADGKKLEDALEEYESVLAEMEKAPRRYDTWMPALINSIGVVAYELKKFDVALDRFQVSLRRAQSAGDKPAEADIFQNLCETAFHKADYEEAKKSCDRSRRINTTLRRKDRLVENHYWLARSHQQAKEKNLEAATQELQRAKKAAEEAFAKDKKEKDEWLARIARAEKGTPEDLDKVAERAEKIEEQRPREKAQFTDLLQFLDQDTSGASEE